MSPNLVQKLDEHTLTLREFGQEHLFQEFMLRPMMIGEALQQQVKKKPTKQ